MYVRVFTQILESSIARDYAQRHLFEDLLKLADREGVIDMTVDAIARRLNVPEAKVEENIRKLEQPDPDSRSQEEEGRRLVRLADHRDWGWQIVNYKFYRDLIDKEALRVSNRDRKRRERERKRHDVSQAVRDNHKVSQEIPHLSVSSSLSSNLNTKEERDTGFALSSSPPPKASKFEKRPKNWNEFLAFCEQNDITRSDAEYLYNHWQANGWMIGKQEIKSWKHAVRTWKSGGYLPSQKPK